jgi:hypothetical protein
MTNTSRNGSKSRLDVSPEAFRQFLATLSPEADQASQLYIRLHHKLVGFFSMKGLSDPTGAADETIDRAVVKIAAGTIAPDVGRYCLGIARNLIMEKLRQTQRESSAFRVLIEQLANSSAEHVERIYHILKPCFEQLASEERQLLVAYCQVVSGTSRSEQRRLLAEKMKTTMLALRMRVTRLRKALTDCVKSNSGEI